MRVRALIESALYIPKVSMKVEVLIEKIYNILLGPYEGEDINRENI
jgi:hypothetical protein